jgi:hypothetical protein
MGLRIINTGQGGVLRARSFGLGGIFRSGYTAPPPPVANLLLDDYPNAAAAYSLRKLRTAYTGAAIRVRRSNDNAEQDIEFDVNGNLDETALTAFVGANSGFVTTWYDLSGDTLNLRQSTAANQPNIVNAGVIRRGVGNRPIINFDGTNDRLENTASIALPSPVANSVFSVWSSSYLLDNTVRTIYEFANIQRLSFEAGSLGGLAFIGWPDANTTSINPSQYITYNPDQIYLLSLIYNGGTASNKDSYTAHRNGTLQTITQGGVSSALGRSTGLSIGARNTAIQHTSCAHREIIIYRSNQSSNRTGIETNINSYYVIY